MTKHGAAFFLGQSMAGINYDGLPDGLQEGMRHYIEHGIQPGGFMTSFLRNDLMEAVQRADEINRYKFREIGAWLIEHAPYNCYGSDENFTRWLSKERLTK